MLVAFEFVEVLDEHASQLLGCLVPLCRILMRILRIENTRVNALELRRHREVEVRDLLRRSLVDSAVQDGIDDATRILDGDAFARAVPARVHEVSAGAVGLHLLRELHSVLRRMQLEECLAEASGERRNRLSDATLRARNLGREARQEIILRLLRRQDGDRRQHLESISRQEDNALRRRAMGNRLNDVLNMVDRIGHTRVLRTAGIGEVDLAVFVADNVLEQGVAFDCAVDIRLGILIEVDDLCVAAALEVEDAFVIPAVLVIADQHAFRIRGQRRLARAGQAEEDSRVLAILVRVSGAMHGGNALQRQEVVHHGEHALLHLTAIPGVDDDLLSLGDIEEDSRIGAEALLFPAIDDALGGIVDHEVRLEVLKLFLARADEHIRYEMSLPSNLDDETDSHARIFVGAAETIDDIQLILVGQLLLGRLLGSFPHLLRSRMVIIRILLGVPPNRVLGLLIHDDVLVLRGTAREFTRLHIDSTELGNLANLIARQTRFRLFLEEHLIGRIVEDFLDTSDAILTQIDICHFTFNLFH